MNIINRSPIAKKLFGASVLTVERPERFKILSYGNRAMNEPSKRDILLLELERERSIRRTAKLLYDKRSRIKDELDRLVSHLSLLVAIPRKTSEDPQPESAILIEAAKRIDDPVFTDLLIQILQERRG